MSSRGILCLHAEEMSPATAVDPFLSIYLALAQPESPSFPPSLPPFLFLPPSSSPVVGIPTSLLSFYGPASFSPPRPRG
jgi:hypothetical protein